MKKIFSIVMIVLGWYACSENEDTPQWSGITRTTFLDERDSSVYQCIVVNGQTWMAENLHYRLPLGANDGCYSFYESPAAVSGSMFAGGIQEALTSGELVDPRPLPPTESMTMNLFYLEMGFMTIDEFKEMYEEYPDVLLALDQIETRLLEKVTEEKLLEAEEKNGGYGERFGFLYTYEAALKALPQGWTLPTDEDWKNLEKALGMKDAELNREEAWRGKHEGYLMKEGEEGAGFDVRMGGGKLYGTFPYGSSFQNLNSAAYFWTSTLKPMNDSTQVSYIRKLNYVENRIFRGTSSVLTTAYSVRGIKK